MNEWIQLGPEGLILRRGQEGFKGHRGLSGNVSSVAVCKIISRGRCDSLRRTCPSKANSRHSTPAQLFAMGECGPKTTRSSDFSREAWKWILKWNFLFFKYWAKQSGNISRLCVGSLSYWLGNMWFMFYYFKWLSRS